MSEEKVYTFNEYVLGYDSGRNNDRSCLTISKILNDNMYVMSTLYDGSAEVISTILDSLQQKVEQLEKENKKLNNIINECSDDILKELKENHHLSYGVALSIRNKLLDYKELKENK